MANQVIDPVCRMEIDPKAAAGTAEYEGVTYYFCSAACKKNFDRHPDKYAKKA